jgi:hypothetical protein
VAGQYGLVYCNNSNWVAGMLPCTPTFNSPTTDAIVQANVKDLGFIPTLSGMVCGTAIGSNTQIDPYDPGFSAGVLGNTTFPPGGLKYYVNTYGNQFTHAAAVMIDEADNMFYLDDSGNNPNGDGGSHADGALVLLDQNPSIPHNKANTFTYTDHELYAKQALRDYLKGVYPTISALNTAWGTGYTTFDTSDAGGLAGITSGTYASWGTGTGFLDENGTNVLSAFAKTHCGGASGNGLSPTDNWGANAQIVTDVHNFFQQLAAKHTSQLRTQWLVACGSTCPLEMLPLYDPTTYVAKGVVGNVDILWLEMSYYASNAAAVTEMQAIIGVTGNLPIIISNYMRANPDSFVAPQACVTGDQLNCSTTQATRGANYVSYEQALLHLKNAAGKVVVIGMTHWSLYDSPCNSECRNFGLFTPNDNAYDGSSASTATSSGACATNTVYTMPAICKDSNNNFESLSLPVGQSSCTSGGSAPTWPPGDNTKLMALTGDATCSWFNGGTYTRTAESATWGNALLPILNFQTGNLADPAVSQISCVVCFAHLESPDVVGKAPVFSERLAAAMALQ